MRPRTTWLSILPLWLVTSSATAIQPLPFSHVAAESENPINAAFWFDGGWVAVGRSGLIATVRDGKTTYYPSPSIADWSHVWVAPTGELFLAGTRSNGTVAAVRDTQGGWKVKRLSEYGRPVAILGLSKDEVYLAIGDQGISVWSGANWQAIENSPSPSSSSHLVLEKGRVHLLGSGAYRVTRTKIYPEPSLNHYSGVIFQNGQVRYAIRQSDLLRREGQRWVVAGAVNDASEVVSSPRRTLLVSDRHLFTLGPRGPVRLGPDPDSPLEKALYPQLASAEIVAALPTPEGARVLMSSGQEALFVPQRIQFLPSKDRSVPPAELENLSCPIAAPVAKPQGSGLVPPHQTVRGTIIKAKDRQYSISVTDTRYHIQQNDGISWSDLFGPAEVLTWPGTPEHLFFVPKPEPVLYVTGSGYLISAKGGAARRITLPHFDDAQGMVETSQGVFLYGQGKPPVRLVREGRFVPQTVGGRDSVDALCESGGRVIASSASSCGPLWSVRRSDGHFASVNSDQSWRAAMQGLEFGPVLFATGSATDGIIATAETIQRFDGERWTPMLTSTGLGLRALSSARGYVMAAGEDGFIYTRPSPQNKVFVRGPHLDATVVFVDSPTLAIAVAQEKFHKYDGKRWTEQRVAKRKDPSPVVSVVRYQGRLLALETSGEVLAWEMDRWQRLPASDPVRGFNRLEQDLAVTPEYNSEPTAMVQPCGTFTPQPETLVVISCSTQRVATLKNGAWSSYPLFDTLLANPTCIEGDACYVLGEKTPYRGEVAGFLGSGG